MTVRLLTRLFKRSKLDAAEKGLDEHVLPASEQQLQEQRQVAPAGLQEQSIVEAIHAYLEIQERQRQDLAHQITAFTSESFNNIAERFETRVQTATIEAKAYSDDAAQVLVLGLRSQGRVLAKHKSSIAESSSIQQKILQEISELRDQIHLVRQSFENLELDGFRKTIERLSGDVEGGIAGVSEQLRADYNQQLRNVEGRLEFVRREILYELQARVLRFESVENNSSRFKAKIVSPEKIQDQIANGLLLNIGCGHIPLDGYINVDRRDLPGVDIVADATNIPVAPGSVTEIIASHLVEHFSLRTLEDVVLPYWSSLLAPHGRLILVAPDGNAMLEAVSDGSMPFEEFREVLFGGQEYEGDFHLNLVTIETVTSSLKRCGFDTVTVDYKSRRNGLCYEFRVTAKRAGI